MSPKFDFIIVGGGTAGCLLANNLSNSAKRPSVLLVETGGDKLKIVDRQPYNRFMNAFILPQHDHGYFTVPQKNLGGRSIQYQRGKGLGGSSLINFMVYGRGPSMDFEHWADLVGDDDWNWKAAKSRYNRLESLQHNLDDKYKKYFDPKPEDHGYNGPIKVSVPVNDLDSDMVAMFDAAVDIGFPANLDSNSGEVIGVSTAYVSAGDGIRTTSESAFLASTPTNLTIWSGTQVAKVLLDGKTAVGIETVDGMTAYAVNEVILSAGAIDTPKILLLSGIGPSSELLPLGITPLHDLPGVGKNATDHLQIIVTNKMNSSYSDRIAFALDTSAQGRALEQWTTDHTGPLSKNNSNAVIFGRAPELLETDAFKALDEKVQKFLANDGIPHFEIISHGPLIPPSHPMTKDDAYTSHVTALMNPQSRGSITLQSSDPLLAPLIDPNFLDNPYDKESFFAAVRTERRLMKTEALGKYYKEPIHAAAGDCDADLENFMINGAGSFWHFACTAKMGKEGDKMAVVDSNLKVFGLKGLRIADLSVPPFSPNAHTQGTGYLIGLTAADKLIAEYKLDVV